MTNLGDFDFELPPHLIAQEPPARRRDARLLVWLGDGRYEHAAVSDIVARLRPDDLLVINDTKVFPARLFGRKRNGEAQVEVLLVRAQGRRWEALVRPGRRLPPGTTVDLAGDVPLEVGESSGFRLRWVQFPDGLDVFDHCRRHGHVPLPPYIERSDDHDDAERYQTVFARETGSVAAPTAGLHFDQQLLTDVVAAGATVAPVCLHVGPGTFRPVTADDVARGTLHSESYSVPKTTSEALRACRAAGGRVIAVGTTVCRTLESMDPTAVGDQSGETDLFLQPGSRLRVVDVLMTNFHLPGSSLIMLVAAFAGPRWKQAYATAIEHGYRFYSYGDANWIERGQT